MKKILIFSVILVYGFPLLAQQGVAINNDGSVPASSAMLNVQSTSRGFLLPRMTTAQGTAIEVNGVDLTNATTILTPRNAIVMPSYIYSGGPNQYLMFYNSSGSKVKVSFSVLVYKTN